MEIIISQCPDWNPNNMLTHNKPDRCSYNKHCLWFSSAAVTLHTDVTSLELIKDVIKHHQRKTLSPECRVWWESKAILQKRQWRVKRPLCTWTGTSEHMSHLRHLNYKNRWALGYLHKHTRGPASCFLPPGERSDKQYDSGDASGLLDGLRQDATASSADRKVAQWAAAECDPCCSYTAATWDGCTYKCIRHLSLTLTYKSKSNSVLCSGLKRTSVV